MNSDSSTTCPKCGTALTADSPEGLCPSCLMAGVMAPTEPAAGNAAPTLEDVAEAFPNLEIDSLIGHGGMGAVYKARQPHLDRWVALKVLSTELSSDKKFAERFSREARVLAKLNHPNIVTLHDFGQAGDYFFLLMEYVDGVNLRQAMRTGEFTPDQALNVVPKICEALQYAHSEGILHRDIKPDNILLDSRGHLKIADFGIAKVVGTEADPFSTGSSSTAPGLTHASTSLGTPQYMAPEQVTDPNKVDHRADIYSLGVVFYEMLTGELPSRAFVPPSQVSKVDDRIDAVVQRALEQEREQRQQSADEVRTEVETIAQTPPPIPPSSVKRRLGAGWAVAFIAFGLLVPLLATMGLRFYMAKEMRSQAEHQQASEIVDVNNIALVEIDAQLAQETNPATIADLEEERAKAERNIAGARRTLAEQGSASDGSSPPNGVSFLALLVISLPFLGIGTWRGWVHLRDLRAGRSDQGGGRAMFAALFLPLIVLFGAVFALIYVPASNATGVGRSMGTSLAFVGAFGACFWLARITWRWAYRIETPPRTGHSRLTSGAIKLLAAVCILAIIAVPVMLVVYWKMAAAPSSSFTAPSSASVGTNTDSTYCVYEGNEVQFILYYPGDFSTSTSSSSNHSSRTWNNDGALSLLPNHQGVTFYRHSGDPNTLRLSGEVYRLDEGRVFSIYSPTHITQLDFPAKVVSNQEDLERFSKRIQQEVGLPSRQQ